MVAFAFIMKEEVTGFAEDLVVWWERKKAVKANFKVVAWDSKGWREGSFGIKEGDEDYGLGEFKCILDIRIEISIRQLDI